MTDRSEKAVLHFLSTKRTLALRQASFRCGGAEEDRTPDLNTASVALSQLSYSPKWPFGPTLCCRGGGEEARTPDLDSAIVALSQLSYTPATLR